MIELALRCHAATPAPSVHALRVQLALLSDGALALRYAVDADAGSLQIPASASAERRDELWRHSCFELFVATGARSYREFNFSPSGDWAVYDFASYRDAMLKPPVDQPPFVRRDAADLAFTVTVPAALLQDVQAGAAALGISAVIEDAASRLSYWSLRHAPGNPDFHHRDGFMIEWPLPRSAAQLMQPGKST